MDLNRFIAVSRSELISTILLFVLVTALVFSSRLYRLTSSSVISFNETTELILPTAGNIDDLISALNDHEISFNDDELTWASGILGWKRMQRGRYELEGSYSYNKLLSKLARGIQDPVSVIVVPGIRPQRLANDIARKLNFSSQDFLTALNDSSYLAEKGLSAEQLFGRMYPETYLVYWTATPRDIINKVTREFKRTVVDRFQEQAEEMDITIDEAVIMASIIEWEAKDEEEKPLISGLYWNRLNKGMRLQADPTVNFAVGERRRLVFEDYKLDHEYNTYLYGGLPPGPVTNPSLSSIRAALNPAEHDYLFMVASPEGGHVFTETFEEHIEESKKWRSWIRRQYQIRRQQEIESTKDSGTK